MTCRSGADVAAAIVRLAVRGAPLIGVAAAYGLALDARADPGAAAIRAAAARLRDARPTAANLAWAVDRVAAAALAAGEDERAAAAEREARAIEAEDVAASRALAARGAELLAGLGVRRVYTHCNTGALAASGHGTALAVIRALAALGPVEVLAGETRPLLQGARLTAWELDRAGLPFALVADAAAAGLIARGEADAVVVGFDRVAADGVGGQQGRDLRPGARRTGGRDPLRRGGARSRRSTSPRPDGAAIPIEERDADEVRHAGGALVTVPGVAVRNPAFDVTPPELVTAIVTERGVARPPLGPALAAMAG